MTLGEARIQTAFNPSTSGVADEIKQKSASLIDICEGLRTDGVAFTVADDAKEHGRLIDLAQTAYEEAAMWAVKAATFGK